METTISEPETMIPISEQILYVDGAIKHAESAMATTIFQALKTSLEELHRRRSAVEPDDHQQLRDRIDVLQAKLNRTQRGHSRSGCL